MFRRILNPNNLKKLNINDFKITTEYFFLKRNITQLQLDDMENYISRLTDNYINLNINFSKLNNDNNLKSYNIGVNYSKSICSMIKHSNSQHIYQNYQLTTALFIMHHNLKYNDIVDLHNYILTDQNGNIYDRMTLKCKVDSNKFDIVSLNIDLENEDSIVSFLELFLESE